MVFETNAPDNLGMKEAPVGILMLDTRFPRPSGDAGNPETWPFPVVIRRVPRASPDRAVRGDPADLTAAFVEAGRGLVAEGCGVIATTCGFLAPMQRDLATALRVPVVASALMQAPMVASMLPEGRRVGILTIEARSLSRRHLRAAGVPVGTAVEGLDGGHMAAAILSDAADLDRDRCRAELVAAARRLVERAPEIGAIILECANMPPYASDVAAAVGRPVFSILDAVGWARGAAAPRRFRTVRPSRRGSERR